MVHFDSAKKETVEKTWETAKKVLQSKHLGSLVASAAVSLILLQPVAQSLAVRYKQYVC